MPPSLTSFRSLLKWQLLREDFPDHWLKTAPPSLFLTLLFFTAVTSTCCCLVAKLCLTFLRPYGLYLTRLLCPDFPGKNTGMGCHFLLQDIFLTQGLNCISCIGRQILYHWATREACDKCYDLWNWSFLIAALLTFGMDSSLLWELWCTL